MLAAKSHSPPSRSSALAVKPKGAVQPPAENPSNSVWERLAWGIQTKLTVGAPDDPYEREADQVADHVMRMTGDQVKVSRAPLSVRRACPACRSAGGVCPGCEEELRRQREGCTDHPTPTVPPIAHEVLRSPGEPLDAGARSFFGSRFGRDFSGVRVHTDAKAAESAETLGARAFAYGQHIAFGAGRYRPETDDGKRLLAHELTHVIQQPGHVALQPESTPRGEAKCRTDAPPGEAHAALDDHTKGPSGTYYIWGPPYDEQPVGTYGDLTIQAWIRWRFGKVSDAVAMRIRTETSTGGLHWGVKDTPSDEQKPPDKGCQARFLMSMDFMNYLVTFADRDKAAAPTAKAETAAGLPELPPPAPIPDEADTVTVSGDPSRTSAPPRKPIDPRAAAEKALDPTSVYEAGIPGANMPPFPADMEGPEMEVPGGIGTFTMRLNYEADTSDPFLLLAYHMSVVNYTWELFNVTQIVRAGMGKGILKEAQKMRESPEAAAAAGGANRQRMVSDIDQLSEETIRSMQELRDPRKAAEGRSAVDVMTRAWANELNLELLGVSEIVAAGGWLVRGLSSLLDGYDKEKEIALPNEQGYYMVRCIAQPLPRGPEHSERRAASVRAKIVEVRPAATLAKNVLEMPDAIIAELQARKVMTSDPEELARLDDQIARIVEQFGSIRRDEKGNVVEERAPGDIVAYLERLVKEKQSEVDAAPDWQKGRLKLEKESLDHRLKQANESRDKATGVHHRPRIAFTSLLTGDTYPLLVELTEIPTDSGARVQLTDVTVPDRSPIPGSGANLDAALNRALEGLAESGLGRGYLVVRLPVTWPGGARELPPIRTLDGPTQVVRRRLADLASALMVLSLVVPGAGEVSMVIGAALAVERLISRAINGTLRLDAESISDTLAVLGAIAQGAQLIGQLRVVKASKSFIAAAKIEKLAGLEAAAAELDSALTAGKILRATSTVLNVGGLIWGNLVSIDQMAKLQQDEIEGRISHAEARRRRADMLASAITSNGVMLAGVLRPHGAGRAAGTEQPLPERVAPEGAPGRGDTETLAESELERRAAESAAPKAPGSPTEVPPKGVRSKFKTPDGEHTIFILNNGTVIRCSSCAHLRTWYDSYLKSQPEGARRQRATQLDSRLQALEDRAAGDATTPAENTPALNEALGKLDIALREFIAPDLAAELQRSSESRKLVKPGEQFLNKDQVRHLLKFFNVDEIQALTGPDGLPSAESIRRFASRPEEFLGQVKEVATRLGKPIEQIARALADLSGARTTEADVMSVLQGFTANADIATLGSLLDTMAAGGTQGTEAADFIGRVARIRQVEGVKFDLTELHAAFQRGDAILDHGPLQTGQFLNDMVRGQRATLGEGRLDVGTSGGKLPYSLPRVLDFVIIETDGTFRLVLGLDHTGLSGGRASVFAAGRLKFNEQGIVTEIDDLSGHYRPSKANLDRAVQFMYDRAIFSSQRGPTNKLVRPVNVTYK
jgi:hypothetical protein